ncbi:hypothetical protein [Vibrio mangrovi]|uniref:Uncharacterized protein n=1 Tax=Vibrio mangrovi TaxID=474394 RepID=A0A1Y6INI5_9VIBR|nr:hypothetical protein [Vibrio mangrovi]MDW6003979.1 hypothetical protein [Vibrio mangrovi]SMR99225.1 hypothetical protein VIM7927_00449 [Vibrio mangrovi]
MYTQQDKKSQSNHRQAIYLPVTQRVGNKITGLVDNRPEIADALTTRESLKSTPAVQQRKVHSIPGSAGAVVQREPIPATVNGISHLVKMEGKSIFRGTELPGEIVHGQQLIIETNGAKRSRRGPNQERFAHEDEERGTHIYRWYRVLQVGPHRMPEGVYVREDAIQIGAESNGDIGFMQNHPPSLETRVGERVPHMRTPESRAMDRLSRAFWIPMMESLHRSEYPPHLAATLIGGRLHMRGNLGDREIPQDRDWGKEFTSFVAGEKYGGPKWAVKKRDKMKRKLQGQAAGKYHPPGITDMTTMAAVQAAIVNPRSIDFGRGEGESREVVHGEMRLQDEIASGIGGRDQRMPRRRIRQQHISGVLEDCAFCHWAHAIFNQVIGEKHGIQLTSAGTHGGIPAKWKAPEWMIANPEAMEMFIKKLHAEGIKFKVAGGYITVLQAPKASGNLPDDSDSDDEHIR